MGEHLGAGAALNRIYVQEVCDLVAAAKIKDYVDRMKRVSAILVAATAEIRAFVALLEACIDIENETGDDTK